MSLSIETGTLVHALERSTTRLINAQVDGVWRGELSSSALSTATAIIALTLVDRERRHPENGPRIRAGLEWLLRHQNEDGGWGDTLQSVSNISTTALCWAAISIVGGPRDDCRRAEISASRWLAETADGHGVKTLISAVTARYGKDHTFSVPILTVLALAGKLGPEHSGWRRVPQLPFELAACPHQWFRWLKLPVVSYALPALIAIGQVRHHHAPSSNPLVRAVRNAARARTLRVLASIQPTSGGFLEATPLTSFVTMSLAASGNARHPVAKAGVKFLRESARPDGSWPIDTDLATWVTTLSINALSESPAYAASLSLAQRRHLRDWLLGQQYRVEHPYTHAAPGGWAWTELPGGVPDADDTPGALLALHHLDLVDAEVVRAAEAGITWLLDLQNGDGGMPTFCKGWGTLPFDRSGADLTAHALLACHIWKDRVSEPLRRRIERLSLGGLRYLGTQQRPDGSWIPLWFGNQHVPGDDNPTYGTSRVLLALHALEGTLEVAAMRGRGNAWLQAAQNPDGGWGGDHGIASSIEETALAVHALASDRDPSPELQAAVDRGVAWLVEHTAGGTAFPPSPIGFYFAKLWYFEELYPLIFTVGALGRAVGRMKDEG